MGCVGDGQGRCLHPCSCPGNSVLPIAASSTVASPSRRLCRFFAVAHCCVPAASLFVCVHRGYCHCPLPPRRRMPLASDGVGERERRKHLPASGVNCRLCGNSWRAWTACVPAFAIHSPLSVCNGRRRGGPGTLKRLHHSFALRLSHIKGAYAMFHHLLQKKIQLKVIGTEVFYTMSNGSDRKVVWPRINLADACAC